MHHQTHKWNLTVAHPKFLEGRGADPHQGRRCRHTIYSIKQADRFHLFCLLDPPNLNQVVGVLLVEVLLETAIGNDIIVYLGRTEGRDRQQEYDFSNIISGQPQKIVDPPPTNH